MVRKCGGFVFILLLLMALGLAMAQAQAHKSPDDSIWFSAPCKPALPAFKAADQLKAVLRIDAAFHAENGETPAGGVRRKARFRMIARKTPPPAPQTFPPLWHRPPPVNS